MEEKYRRDNGIRMKSINRVLDGKCDPDCYDITTFCMSYFNGKCPKTCFYATEIRTKKMPDAE